MAEMTSRKPDIRLRPFIKTYFAGKDEKPPEVQRTVPNGEMGLFFYRTALVCYDGRGTYRSCLSGQSVRYQDIISHEGIDVVGVQFTSLGARMFLHAPLYCFYDDVIALQELPGEGWQELEERVMTAATHEECWQVFDTFFLKELPHSTAETENIRRLQRAIAYGQRHVADARIDDVALSACLSTRQLNRVFADIIGMPPKEYLRLQRFHHTVRSLKVNREDTLTSIAWNNGYCDTSHITVDFRKICGYTPHELLEVSRNDSDTYGWRI